MRCVLIIALILFIDVLSISSLAASLSAKPRHGTHWNRIGKRKLLTPDEHNSLGLPPINAHSNPPAIKRLDESNGGEIVQERQTGKALAFFYRL